MFSTIYFAPGPRIKQIPVQRLESIFALSPVIHLNKEEILTFTGDCDLSASCKHLFALTNNTVIVTDGEHGAYCYDSINGLMHVEGRSAEVVDTIGAGDTHIGAVIAARKLGYNYVVSLWIANQAAAMIVETKGALLDPDVFESSRVLPGI